MSHSVRSLGGQAAVKDEFGPGRVTGIIRGQEEHRLGDFFRLSDPLERNHLGKLFNGFVGVALMDHGRVDDARMNRVDPDAIVRQLKRRGLGEAPNGKLGIRVPNGTTDQPVDGRHVHDASVVLGFHGRGRILGSQKDAELVDLKNLEIIGRTNRRRGTWSR